MSIVREGTYTADEILRMPEAEYCDLINGQLVEPNPSVLASWVAGGIMRRIADAIEEKRAGWVFSCGVSYQCFDHLENDPQRVRRPDVSFIRWDRLPGGLRREECHERNSPELTVEVVTPDDLASEVKEKVRDWLGAGVPEVWVVNPLTRTVAVLRPDGSERILHENDELTAEELIPGFRCRVGDLFPSPPQRGTDDG